MASPRQLARSLLARLLARVLIAALLVSLLPPPHAEASIQSPPLPPAPLASRALPELAVQAPAAAEDALLCVVVVVADPIWLTKSAFGELLAHTGSDPQPYAFAGEPYDPNSGFQYHRARWMDPRVGRFVSVDPFAGNSFDPPSLHKYLYAAADPLNKVDPSGKWNLPSITVVVAITTILGASYGGYVGGWRGAVQGAAAGFVFGVALYEVAALVIGIGMAAAPTITLWPRPGGPPTITLPKNAPVTVTLPQGPATTVTISPPISSSLRLAEASTRTGGLVQRAQQIESQALRLEAEQAVAAWQRAINSALRSRGGSYQAAPGGTAPANLDEAAANFRGFWAEVDAQLTLRQQSLIDDLLDGSI